MTRSSAPAARPRRSAWLPAAGLLAALLAFAGGWLAADLSATAPADRGPSAGATPGRPVVLRDGRVAMALPPPGEPREVGQVARDADAPALAEPPADLPARPAVRSGRVSPEVTARVAEAARQGLEAARAELVARCVPPERLAAGGPAAPFTFSLTFDASGREIARGIGEDRRRRAPEVASCLRRLPLGSLRVPPPGASVGVRVALSLP